MTLAASRAGFVFAVFLAVAGSVRGDELGDRLDEARQRGAKVGAILPIYSQLVRLSLPAGLEPAFEKDAGAGYIFEWVPPGQTVQQWTRMLTVTGARGAARDPDLTPQRFVTKTSALSFQRACSSTFSSLELGSRRVGDYDAFATVLGCGTVPGAVPHSETAVILAIKGTAEFYTIQWAERSAALDAGPVLDPAAWTAKLDALLPIFVCDRITGEAPPFPSCVNRK